MIRVGLEAVQADLTSDLVQIVAKAKQPRDIRMRPRVADRAVRHECRTYRRQIEIGRHNLYITAKPDEIKIVFPAFRLFVVCSLETRSTKSDHDVRRLPSRMPIDFRIDFIIECRIIEIVEDGLAASESDEGGTLGAAPLFRFDILFMIIHIVPFHYVFEFIR